MTNGAMNVEIGNPAYKIYEGDPDDDAGELLDSDFALDPDKVKQLNVPVYKRSVHPNPKKSHLTYYKIFNHADLFKCCSLSILNNLAQNMGRVEFNSCCHFFGREKFQGRLSLVLIQNNTNVVFGMTHSLL